jgi:hypothetical protein
VAATDCQAEEPAERDMQVATVRRQADRGEARRVVAPDRVGGKRDVEPRHLAQHMGHEAVGVRPRPDPVVAVAGEGIGRDRRLHDRQQGCRRLAGDRLHDPRRVRIPVAVGDETVAAHGQAPADLVVAVVVSLARPFQHDPAMGRKRPLEAAGARGEHVDRGVAAFRGRQEAAAAPVRRTPGCRPVDERPPQGGHNRRQGEQHHDAQNNRPEECAHGFSFASASVKA